MGVRMESTMGLTIVYQQTILMKYHALFVIFEKQQNLKLSSAANYRWRFMLDQDGEHTFIPKTLKHPHLSFDSLGSINFILYA